MMKWNHARLMLVAGLSFALGDAGFSQLSGADAPVKKVVRLAQAPAGPSADPTPLKPIPDPGASSASPNASVLSDAPAPPVVPQPVPSTTSGVTTAPLQGGSPPALAPANRQPLGMFYGEQDRLDAINNPPARPLQPIPSTVGPSVFPTDPNAPGTPIGTSPVLSGSPVVLTDRFGVAPPPGTLGQTYKRRSALIDESKHPRVGIVDVHLPEAVDVTAKGLKSKWTGKVWRLESDSLMPGVPHIFEVKASWGEGTQPQVRTVRLIMGRVVDLEF